MIINLYSVRDVKSGFGLPQYFGNNEAAMRDFKLCIRNAKTESLMGFVPEDFELWFVGRMNTDDGSLISELPTRLIGGADYEISE